MRTHFQKESQTGHVHHSWPGLYILRCARFASWCLLPHDRKPMNSSEQAQTPISPGDKAEKLAFTFCKCATVALFCGKFALPVAATLSAILYIVAHSKGTKETRCIIGPPIRVAAFWIVVVGIWVWWNYFRLPHPTQ